VRFGAVVWSSGSLNEELRTGCATAGRWSPLNGPCHVSLSFHWCVELHHLLPWSCKLHVRSAYHTSNHSTETAQPPSLSLLDMITVDDLRAACNDYTVVVARTVKSFFTALGWWNCSASSSSSSSLCTHCTHLFLSPPDQRRKHNPVSAPILRTPQAHSSKLL